jgi:hypothetical protein
MKKDFLEQIHIASPCSVGWENMTGDERTRFCNQCSLHVYNISAMTKEEVASLISTREGRICARIYRRADGTVLTRDCPVGLRAVRRRVSKMAGAVLTAVLALCAGAFGQSQTQEDKSCTLTITLKMKKVVDKDEQGTMSGVVMARSDGIVTGARITLTDEQSGKKLESVSTDGGAFKFSHLAAGKYTLTVEAAGFKTSQLTNIPVNPDEAVQATVALELSDVKGEVKITGVALTGIMDIGPDVEPKPLIEHSNGTTIIRGEMIQRLPLP